MYMSSYLCLCINECSKSHHSFIAYTQPRTHGDMHVLTCAHTHVIHIVF